MRILTTKKLQIAGFTLLILFVSSVVVYSYINGITGRTRKTSTSGCGGCHGSSATTGVTVTITGPDTVITNQTAMYSLTITYAGQTGAGLDIATRSGTLTAVSSNIHLSNGELTHNNNIAMTNSTVTVQFNYHAPAATTLDTIWATGNATNSNGGTSGDFWNWAPSKRVVVTNPVGIQNEQSVAHSFKLEQNYPNPFNPSTEIHFSVPKAAFISMKIYDINGKEVYSLVGEKYDAGSYSVKWNSENQKGDLVPSGIYFYRMEAGAFTETKKMILVR